MMGLTAVALAAAAACATSDGSSAGGFGIAAVQQSSTGLSSTDGYIAEGQSVSPFDDSLPAIAHLEPKLKRALQRAAWEAARQGVTLRVNSGWRAGRYQQFLLDRAVKQYGSLQTARRFVNTPDKSTHVRGMAVDIGPTDADSWLSQHGIDYGLCQTYANEPWHFELSAQPGTQCPAALADASAG